MAGVDAVDLFEAFRTFDHSINIVLQVSRSDETKRLYYELMTWQEVRPAAVNQEEVMLEVYMNGCVSLFFSMVTMYVPAWEKLVDNANEAEGGPTPVKQLYGHVLKCFMHIEDDSTVPVLEYQIQNVIQPADIAAEVSARKLRNAIAHKQYRVLTYGTYPWMLEFRTNHNNEIHCFQISSSGLANYFFLVSKFSRDGHFTERAIRDELRRFARDVNYQHHQLLHEFL